MYVIRSIFLLCAIAALAPASAGAQKKEYVLRADAIVTMDPKRPFAEAIGVRDGKIAVVGTVDEVRSALGLEVEVIELDGCLLPGFIEPHTHPAASAALYSWVDISGFSLDTREEVVTRLRLAAENTPKGEWIVAFGFDPILVPDLEAFTADFLDSISTDHPIFVMIQSMHSVFVNHLAFERAGITDDTRQPGSGGEFVKDSNGRLTGMLREATAMVPFVFAMGMPRADESRRLMAAQMKRYAEAGITTIGVAGLLPGFIQGVAKILREQAEGDTAQVRVRTYGAGSLGSEAVGAVDGARPFARLGVKLWYDGSPYTGTMLLDAPYLDSALMQKRLGIPAGTHGHANFSPEAFAERLSSAHAKGVQIAVHTQGDRSTREVVDAFSKLLESHPRPNHRHRLEHLALVTSADLRRATELGLVTSFHVNHIYYYGQALRDGIVGPDRAERLMPIGDALRHGQVFSFHTDSPMYPPNPLLTVRTAVTRLTREGDVIGARQAIPVEEALKGITINAAYQLFLEDLTGSITVGKMADFTWLAKNPLTVPPEDLHRIQVRGTWLRGSQVWASEVH